MGASKRPCDSTSAGGPITLPRPHRPNTLLHRTIWWRFQRSWRPRVLNPNFPRPSPLPPSPPRPNVALKTPTNGGLHSILVRFAKWLARGVGFWDESILLGPEGADRARRGGGPAARGGRAHLRRGAGDRAAVRAARAG